MFGPFVHALNKGGLEDIVKNKRLLATAAAGTAGGSDGVRAHNGSFKELYTFRGWNIKPDPQKIFVEFSTSQPPMPFGAPGKHCEVRWPIEGGKYLPISVTGVFNGAGQKIG